MAADEELAEALASEEEGMPVSRISQWTPELEAFAAIFDRLGVLVSATIGAAGVKPPEIQPYPRPTTAIERARENADLDRHESLAQRLLAD